MSDCAGHLALMLALFLLFGAPARAAAAGEPCPVTSISREWSATCFDTGPGGRKVKTQFLSRVRFGRQSHAALIILSPSELVFVNRRGTLVRLQRKYLDQLDFDFEPAEGAIGRFGYLVGKGTPALRFKCGFYRRSNYEVLVAPIYDECDSFNDGTALVCLGCKDYCDSGDCHDSNFAGGEGLVINEKHEILERFPLPSLPLCRSDAEASAVEGDSPKCRPRPPNPFDKLMK